jgi:hypothetical protein
MNNRLFPNSRLLRHQQISTSVKEGKFKLNQINTYMNKFDVNVSFKIQAEDTIFIENTSSTLRPSNSAT